MPVVAAFLFAATAIAANVGASLLFPGAFLDRLWDLNPQGAALFRRIGPISGVFLWALAAGTCAAALGLLRGSKWAWRFALVLFTVDGAGDLVSYFFTGDWLKSVVGLVVTSAFLYSLARPPVRRYFESS